MPKPKFDPDSAFKKIVSKNQESESIEETKDSKPSKKKKATEGTKQMERNYVAVRGDAGRNAHCKSIYS